MPKFLNCRKLSQTPRLSDLNPGKKLPKWGSLATPPSFTRHFSHCAHPKVMFNVHHRRILAVINRLTGLTIQSDRVRAIPVRARRQTTWLTCRWFCAEISTEKRLDACISILWKGGSGKEWRLGSGGSWASMIGGRGKEESVANVFLDSCEPCFKPFESCIRLSHSVCALHSHFAFLIVGIRTIQVLV